VFKFVTDYCKNNIVHVNPAHVAKAVLVLGEVDLYSSSGELLGSAQPEEWNVAIGRDNGFSCLSSAQKDRQLENIADLLSRSAGTPLPLKGVAELFDLRPSRVAYLLPYGSVRLKDDRRINRVRREGIDMLELQRAA
jgi:hypothetical protein